MVQPTLVELDPAQLRTLSLAGNGLLTSSALMMVLFSERIQEPDTNGSEDYCNINMTLRKQGISLPYQRIRLDCKVIRFHLN